MAKTKVRRVPRPMKVAAKARQEGTPALGIKVWSEQKNGPPTQVHICLRIGEQTLALKFTTKEGLKSFCSNLWGAANVVWPELPLPAPMPPAAP